MKMFKKTLALMAAVVMAFSMCASAGVIEQKATIETGAQGYIKANDKYIAVVDGVAYKSTKNAKIDIYKRTEAGPEYYCSVAKTIADAKDYAFTISSFDFFSNNVLFMTCYPGGPNLGAGNPQFAFIYLDYAEQEVVNEATTLYSTSSSPSKGYYIKRSDDAVWTREYGPTGSIYRFHSFPAEPPSDDWLPSIKSTTVGYSYSDYGYKFFEDTSYPWYHDKSAKHIKIYQYPENAAGDQIPGTGIAWLDLSALPYDVHMIKGNENYVVVNTAAYPSTYPNYNGIWYYDLSQPSDANNKLKPIKLDTVSEIVDENAGDRIKSMDIEGNLLAVCAQDAKKLNVYDLDTKRCIYTGAIPGQDAYGFEVTINDGEIICANENGGLVLFDINRDLVMNIDSANYDYTFTEEDEAFVAANVEITNGTGAPVSGNIIFASYEGNKLLGVSVKPTGEIAAGADLGIPTEPVPYGTTFKAFFWDADNSPLIEIPFVDSYE